LTGWKVDIEKAETVELGFEEKVARATRELSRLPGLDQPTAQMLVNCGFHSVEGLLAADVNDLIELLGEEKAKIVHDAVVAAQERQERGAAS
jgi:predicted RecB family nuclease